MKNRGGKSGIVGSKKKRGTTDVPPSTSLPPLVQGQLRCFLRVTISKILWTVPRPPKTVLVRIRWWGETTSGTVFHPRDTSQTEQKEVKTTTRYAVHCGAKQLTSYLTDMGALVLDVLTRLDHLPVGRAQIDDISRLTSTRPLNGFFTVVSPRSEKLGELQVSLALEPLSETYDDSGPIPNSGKSQNTTLSVHPPKVEPIRPSKLSAGHTESESSGVPTLRGRDHLYFKENTEPNRGLIIGSRDDDDHVSQNPPSKNKTSVDPTAQERVADQTKGPSGVAPAPAARDLLTALLDQGSKLRDAMVESALQSDPEMDLDADSTLPPVLHKGHYGLQYLRAAPESLTTDIDQDLLRGHKSFPSSNMILPGGHRTVLEPEKTSETRAIELLLGSSPVSISQFWDGTGSPPESIAESDFYNESEFNDPLYDQSLLENLFYKTPNLNDVSGDLVSDGDGDDLSKSRRKKTKTVKYESLEETEEQSSLKVSTRKCRSPELSSKPERSCTAIDLSLDRLTLLGRMHTVRVIVESLNIQPETTQVLSSKGKPPRPASAIKRTFFVEFQFPVSSKNKLGELTAMEITRLVSSKIINGVVKFQQRFVFPILFHGQMIQHWWNSGLTFRIFMRRSTQRKPGLLGCAVLALRDVLRSQDLSVSQSLPVRCVEKQQELEDVGPLKVSVAIAGDSREFSHLPEKSSLRAQDASASPSRPNVSTVPSEDQSYIEDSTEQQTESSASPAKQVLHQPERPQGALSQRETEENGLLLHVILMVPEGKGLLCDPKDSSFYNPYLNCKLFSTQEATRSAVVWGSNQPLFRFSQVAPVTLTRRLLERMKNNVMIVEVWNKVPGLSTDQLLGLAKLPLHQLYMSFSDPKICRLLLQAQYPVVAVDSFVPVIDVFSGCERGQLKVLLAMGSGDQVVALQRLKNEEGTPAVQIHRPAHFLDPPQSSVEVSRTSESSTNHVFEMHVESVKGLAPLQSTVWGEADCFIQYFFPVRSTATSPNPELPERGLSLKPVRTATTLCVPDPVFNDRQSHSLVAPSDTPVQRLLLSAFSVQGLSAGGGMAFEIWCRYYYPNVRDQIVAKALLPLSRLCAMVTMHHREEVGIQAFCLPLTPVSETSADTPPPSSGLLNINVTYRRSVMTPAGMLATRMASISVQIHRASGLQAAARVLAQQDPSFQYSADVGVNAFIIIRPSFLPEIEVRNTRTIARSFCPEFDHHSEFPCNLVLQRSSGEACSLAEILHSSEIVFSIHHRSVTPAGTSRAVPSRDHQLGVVRIPTRHLLTKRSGISGWYSVMVSDDSRLPDTAGILDNVVGGLELSISFTHHADRDRVLEVARGLGWTADEDEDRDEYQKDDLVNLSVTIPKVWLPMRCLLMAGHKHLHKSTYCYLRYKLYDKEVVCSTLERPDSSKDGQQATVVFEQTRTAELMKHQPLVWYLREERLEIQIWRSYGKDTSGPRPQDTDRLLGYAYVDLTVLSENTSRTLTVSGVYPLFKHNVPNLWGAAVRVHLCLSSAYHPSASARYQTSPEKEESLTEDLEASDVSEDGPDGKQDDRSQPNRKEQADNSSGSPARESAAPEPENTFTVNIVVERAMHLSLKGSPLTERAGAIPSCCVSFPVAGTTTPVSTPVVDSTDSPTWNFQQQARLSKELLLDPRQTLVFKVWHKADVERVLGFASVDLSPLLSGFQSVCGWYNIGDFTGQCQGQIKVSITPLENISHLREEKRLRKGTSSRQPQVTSHPSSLYYASHTLFGSFPAFPPPHTVDVTDVQQEANKRANLFPSVKHDDHTETMRRFQESVQQAEENTWSAEHMNALSQSSRTSLLSALSKNLSELDDIQKYFNQKLYRSLSSVEPAEGAPLQSGESKHPNAEDIDTHLLLTKSNLLVSQVSNLISGLQENRLFQGPPSSSMRDVTSPVPHTDSELSPARPAESIQEREDEGSDHHTADTPQFSAAGSPPPREDNMEDALDAPLREGRFFQGLESSDEEYEENLIEPRTLNEISTLTDMTSPWSSIISDTEPDHIEHNPGTDRKPPANHSEDRHPLSQMVDTVDPSMALSYDGSCESQSPRNDLRVPSHAESDTEAQEVEPARALQAFSMDGIATSDHCEDGGVDQTRGEERMTSVEADDTHAHDESEDRGAEKEEERGSQSDSTHPGTSEEEATGPAAHSSERSGHLLSDPVRLPNFFLPPEQLEASLRVLSLSSAVPSDARKDNEETGAAKGIPYRRRPHRAHRTADGQLPQAEINRIARIFAAQFSSKK